MSPSKTQANEVKIMPVTNDIILFRSPAIWTWKAGHETKIYEQWQGTKKRALVNNLVKWDQPLGSVTNIQSKQARVLRFKKQSKTSVEPVEPVCRSRHWAVKNTNSKA